MKVVWGERTKRMVGEEEDATNQPPSQASAGEKPFVKDLDYCNREISPPRSGAILIL